MALKLERTLLPVQGVAEKGSAGHVEIIEFSSVSTPYHRTCPHTGLSHRFSEEITSKIRSFNDFRR
jgi:hypothetical protein